MPTVEIHTGACPKCFGPVDPDTFWCRACYQKELEGDRNSTGSRDSSPSLPVNSVFCAAAFTVALLTVVVLSVGSRLVFEFNSAERFWYSVFQIVLGGVAYVAAHIASYVHGLRYTDDVEVGDVLTNPLEIWRVAITDLPDSWLRVTVGATGLLAVFLGCTIVDGISIDHLLGDRNYPEGLNLAQYFVAASNGSEREQAEKSDLTLEEAINEFTGHGMDQVEDVDVLTVSSQPEKPELYNPLTDEPEAETRAGVTTSPVRSVRCVVLGFVPGESNGVSGLALGAVFKNRLQFAGIVFDGVNQVVSSDDIARFGTLLQKNPAISDTDTLEEVFWIKPTVTCDIKCRGVDDNGRLIGPVLQAMR